MYERPNRLPVPSFERRQKLLRKRFRLEAPLRLCNKLKLAQIKLRKVTLPHQTQNVRKQKLAVAAGRLMGGQNPIVHPPLDCRDADAQSPGNIRRADIL